MKKFLVVLFLMTAMATVVHATSFEDVEGLNCKSAVESLSQIGIVNGVSLKEFAPNKSVTRAELSKMVLGALKKEASATKGFSDIQGHWGEEFIKQAAGIGILNGYIDGTFRPDQEVSYAEAIAILIRSLGYENLENGSPKWYDNYLVKMKELHLDEGVEISDVEAFANRGDIAILLWNTMKSKANGESLLEKNFPDYLFFEGEKIIEISSNNGRILYRTTHYSFYVDDDIDFSDIGGLASGFLDSKNLTVSELEIDSGRNLKKISGNTKEINQKGYDVFQCNDISGYGTKENANYVEIFVNQNTNQTERVVYYDTTESHFAESLKIGTSKIKIDSKNVYGTSVIVVNGKMETLKILRKETVKEINANAILVYEGKIVPWTTVPDKSVIREIKKDAIYTYVHEYMDVALESKDVNSKGLTIKNDSYVFSEECIAENIITETATKLHESLTTNDIKTIAEKDDKVRVYFNEFYEIVKFEFSYDIWKIQADEEHDEKLQDLTPELKKIGIVTYLSWVSSDEEEDENKLNAQVISLPNKSIFNFKHKEGEFKVGDFVYLTEELTKVKKRTVKETKLNKVSENVSLEHLKIIYNYSGFINNNRLGVYPVTNATQYVEVALERSKEKEGEYRNCSMTMVDSSYFGENTKYKKMHLILDKDNVVLRVYAIKELGSTSNIGIIKNIELEKSGDSIVSQKVYITNENKGMKKYNPTSIDSFLKGDLVTFETKKATDKKTDDGLTVTEVYHHEFIGNEKDMVIEEYKNHILQFKNSKDVIDLSKETFQIAGKEYYFDDYTLVNAEVEKDSKTGEWIFKYFSLPTKNKIKATAGSRFVIDELTRVIVIYNGYEG